MPEDIPQKLRRYFYERGVIPAFNRYTQFRDQFADVRKHVIISGVTRGGTTWLSELLYSPDKCLVWEPLLYQELQKYKRPEFYKELGIVPYIPEDEKWEDAQEYFSLLLTGKIQSFYTAKSHQSANRNLFIADKLLIKFCRANLLLPWLTKNFDIKPIYLIRHPLAVVASQLRHPGYQSMDIKEHIFKINHPKYNDIFEKYRYLMVKINSRESLFAHWWAIQQILLLNHPEKDSRWVTVSHEKLHRYPAEELNRIAEFCSIEIPKDWEKRIRKPSQTAQDFSETDHVSGWKKYLSKEQVSEILDIVHAYGIGLYTDMPEPDYSRI